MSFSGLPNLLAKGDLAQTLHWRSTNSSSEDDSLSECSDSWEDKKVRSSQVIRFRLLTDEVTSFSLSELSSSLESLALGCAFKYSSSFLCSTRTVLMG
jgi:hypothetical protein